MAKGKRNTIVLTSDLKPDLGADLPAEKHDDVGEAAPEVASEPKAARPVSGAPPGLVRVRAEKEYLDGMILPPHVYGKSYVKAGEVIEVTPGTFRQLREAFPNNWTVL